MHDDLLLALSSRLFSWASASMGITSSCVAPKRDVDVLDLRAGEQLLDRFFAAHPRLLVAAEGDADVMRARAVDPDVAGLHFRGEAMGAVEVVRPDRRGEPDV